MLVQSQRYGGDLVRLRDVCIYSSPLHRLPIREFQVLVRVGESFSWQTSHFVGQMAFGCMW